MEQVRSILPVDGLTGRDGELAELAAFCHGTESYWWWQAEPWAGKSALMSWFTFSPPPAITVVSFFITARYASQDDSAAFTVAVLRQLEELLGRDLPSCSTPGEFYSSYRVLLRDAAQHFRQRGQRLVLVVDGLDEDRGLGRGMPSIASLLPKHCEYGLKVIVSGRFHPQIPPDVAPDHPMRNPRITHMLGPSRHARVLRDLAEQELRNFLAGTSGQQDILGLLTAAGGGLAEADLAELTGQAPHEIRHSVCGAPGRILASRAVPWATSRQQATCVYMLAHETLQVAAIDAFGQKQLAAYRDQLHAWADGYRSRAWPPDTPEYLLNGYFPMLQATADVMRLIGKATDSARHSRLLARFGSGAAALAEIAAAADVILDQPVPDLTTMTRLAYYRENLAIRDRQIPVSLPALWVRLGAPDRAVALACSVDDPEDQAWALHDVAAAMAAADLFSSARVLIDSIGAPACRARALAKLAVALAAAGSHEQARQASIEAESAAGSLTEPNAHARAMAEAAHALAAAGLHDRATRAAAEAKSAPRDTASADRNWVLADVAKTLAAAGLQQQAWTTVLSITDEAEHAEVLPRIAEAFAVAGLSVEAEQAARQAHAAACSVAHPDQRAQVLVKSTRALAMAGLHAQAQIAAHAIHDLYYQAQAFAAIAQVLAGAGFGEQAGQAVAQAQDAAYPNLHALATVAQTLAAAGLGEEARRVAAQADTASAGMEDQDGKTEMLAAVAEALAAAGLGEQARRVAARAETACARGSGKDCRALEAVAHALAAAGLYEQARAAANSIPDARERASVLAHLAQTLAAAGLDEQARQMAIQAEDAAYTTAYPDLSTLAALAQALAAAGLGEQARRVAARAETACARGSGKDCRALEAVAHALAAAGLYEQARATADTISKPSDRAQVLAGLALALAGTGLIEEAKTTATLAQAAAHSATLGYVQRWALTKVVHALAAAGLHDRAQLVADSIPDRYHQTCALAFMAQELATTGLPDRAKQAAIRAQTAAHTDLGHGTWTAAAMVARALAAAGLPGQALTAADSIAEHRYQVQAFADVAHALAAAGLHEQAQQAATRARDAAHSIRWHGMEEALATAAGALAAAGLPDQALATADSISVPQDRARALVDVALALNTAGLHEQATQAAVQAQAVALTITYPRERAEALSGTAQAMTSTGQPTRALHLLASAMITYSWTLPSVIKALPPEALNALVSLAVDDRQEAIGTWRPMIQ